MKYLQNFLHLAFHSRLPNVETEALCRRWETFGSLISSASRVSLNLRFLVFCTTGTKWGDRRGDHLWLIVFSAHLLWAHLDARLMPGRQTAQIWWKISCISILERYPTPPWGCQESQSKGSKGKPPVVGQLLHVTCERQLISPPHISPEGYMPIIC